MKSYITTLVERHRGVNIYRTGQLFVAFCGNRPFRCGNILDIRICIDAALHFRGSFA